MLDMQVSSLPKMTYLHSVYHAVGINKHQISDWCSSSWLVFTVLYGC